jgi:UDP-N-acetylmuramate dehydrogenase
MQKNYPLKHLNTLQNDVKALYFKEIYNLEDLRQASEFAQVCNLQIFVLGEGSNLILTQDINQVVIHFKTCEMKILNDKGLVYVDAGVKWHHFVMWTLDNHLAGLENLSLIPGNVGAAPVQNIGAYGEEVQTYLQQVHIFDSQTCQIFTLNKEECQFAYRASIFKSQPFWVITGITFLLHQDFNRVNLNFNALKHLQNINAKQLSDEIIKIRSNKLPNPQILPNVGSFFKNPIITREHLQKLQTFDPEIIFFNLNDNNVKLAAGYLIEKQGFKNKTVGGVGVHQNQALVLVKNQPASGMDVINYANQIIATIFEVYQVKLEIEPLVI